MLTPHQPNNNQHSLNSPISTDASYSPNVADFGAKKQVVHLATTTGDRKMSKHLANLPSFKTELCNPGFWRGALGECVASMMLTFVICATWISWEPYEGEIVKISLASGFIYSALIYSFGPISGGHLNPILSFSFMITRKITIFRGFLYMIAQCTGSTCGALLLFACVPEVIRKNLGVNMMSTSLIPKHGFGFEATLSFILVFMALSTIDSKLEIPGCKSIGIGLTYSALHFAGIYWIGPFFGSAMASLFYFIVFDPYNPINAYRIMNN